MNTLGVAGCEQLDKIFSNFGLINNNGPSGSQITTLFLGASETTGISATFLSANWAALDLGSPVTRQSTISFDVQVDPAFVPPPPNDLWSITSLSLSEVGALASIGAGPANHVQIFEYFCAGSAAFNCTSSSGNYGYIEYEQDGGAPTFGAPTATDSICFNNGGSSCTVSHGSLTLNLSAFPGSVYPGGVSQIAIEDVVSLTAPKLLNVANLNAITNTFVESAETPEPATFSLLGLAFAGIAVVSCRRRRLT